MDKWAVLGWAIAAASTFWLVVAVITIRTERRGRGRGRTNHTRMTRYRGDRITLHGRCPCGCND